MASDDAGAPRIAVFAYSEVGARALERLLRLGQRVVALYTHADDPAEPRWFRSCAQLAQRAGIPVARPERLRDPAVLEALRALEPELIFSFYYRQLIPAPILALPRLGAFNLHGSLLPRYRGRAPVNWAILHGEKETGVTLHHMVARADAGDIVAQEALAIGPEETAHELGLRLAELAADLLERTLPALLRGDAPRVPQDEARASCFGRRGPEDGRIDWSQSAERIANLVRAVTRPFPGAFTHAAQRRLYVWRARALASWPARALEPQRGCGQACAPGEVLAREPFVVAAGEGALELLDWNWRDASGSAAPAPLGTRLGEERA